MGAGTYRESIAVSQTEKTTDAPIVIQAEEKGKAVITGAEVLENQWEQRSIPGVYVQPWPYQLEVSPNVWIDYISDSAGANMTEIVRRRELVFLNGTPLEQVLTREELVSGSFCIEEEKKLIHMVPPAGMIVHNVCAEVSVRGHLFQVEGMNNLVLRGLVFTRGTYPVPQGAVMFHRCSHVLVEDCQFLWNSWDGLALHECSHVTVKGCISNDNGGSGMGYFKGKNVLFEDNETSSNNWRGVKGGFTSWATGGVKALNMHQAIFRRHTSRHNQTMGFWLDWCNRDVLLDRMTLEDNLEDGLFIEASEGPVIVENSSIKRNRYGAYIASTNHARLYNNIIQGNLISQIVVFGDWGKGRDPEDWETGEPYHTHPDDTVLMGNTIVSELPHQKLFDQKWNDKKEGWNRFLETLKADYNQYYRPSDEPSFYGSDSSPISIQQWQNEVGEDVHSTWQQETSGQPIHVNLKLSTEKEVFEMEEEIPLTADVQSQCMDITKVEFYRDREKIGQLTTEPFQFIWKQPVKGSHRMTARVTDEAGRTGVSELVSIIIGE